MTGRWKVSCHGWSLQVDSVLRAVRSEQCAITLHNAVALLPGQRRIRVENPYRAGVEAELRHFCESVDLPCIDQLFAADGVGRLAALCYPDADNEHFKVCMMVMLLAFTFDNILEFRRSDQNQVTVLAAALKSAMAGQSDGQLGRHPLVQLAHNTLKSLKALNPSDSWMDRFRSGFAAFLDMAVADYERWRGGRASLDLDRYLQERYYDIGVKPMLALLELTCGHQLADDRYNDSEMTALRAVCIFNMVFMNDVFSYHREVIQAGNLTNAIAVVQMQLGLSFAHAVVAVVVMAELCYHEFEAQAALILNNDIVPPGEKRYVQSICAWMAGAVQWSRESHRYRHPESPLPELRRAEPATKPSRRSPRPSVISLHEARDGVN